MSTKSHKARRALITLSIFSFLILGTLGAIYFARGYRLNPQSGLTTIQGTGLLSATSYPKAAQVFIDDKLVTATEDTINLAPGEYNVRISKEGFLPWTKTLTIKAELVTATDARLFPAVPSLAALTYTGVTNPTPSPDGKRIAYVITAADDDTKNGLYVMDINTGILSFNRAPSLIAANTQRLNLKDAILTWSPDSKQILVAFTTTTTPTRLTNTYLLNTDTVTNLNSTPDVTLRLPLIFETWEQEMLRTQQTLLTQLPDFMFTVATASAQNVYFSPEGDKMLYTATSSATIPDNLIPPLSSINGSPQQRNLKPGFRYVYDLKEDTNYELGIAQTDQDVKTLLNPSPSFINGEATLSGAQGIQSNQLQKDKTPLETMLALKIYHTALSTNTPQWYPTGRHLITTSDNKITIFEYDNHNHAVVYSGPFDSSFVYPSPNGNRLLILTNLNQNDQPLNLYTLDLK